MKTKTNHTPGPWRTVDLGTGRPMIAQHDSAAELPYGEPDPRFICYVGLESPDADWTDEDQANAKLIAAAPEMLAVLQSVATIDGYLLGKLPQDTIRKVWDVIAKATGQ